jgi:ABC-type lipoprotein export system ATPase subunit
MSHLLEAEVHGLAGKTEPTKISFDPHLSILYGMNGSGKTSLLKILHSAMTGDAQSLKNVPFRRATVHLQSLAYETHVTHIRTLDKDAAANPTPAAPKPSGRYRLGGAIRQPELEWTETLRQDKELALGGLGSELTREGKLANFDHRYLPTTRLYVSQSPTQLSFEWATLTPRLGTAATLTEEALEKNFADVLQQLWRDYTSEIGRSVRAAQAGGLANILRAVMSGSGSSVPSKKPRLNLERAYESVKQFLVRQGSPDLLGTFASFARRYENDKFLQAIVHDIYSVEQDVETATEPQKRLEGLIRRLYSGNKNVIFSETSINVESTRGEQIGLESLSSGEKQLIRMFLECLCGGPNPILIDEPEISIHIDWQRELMGILQSLNQKAQFVVASHSPELMADVPDERLFLL